MDEFLKYFQPYVYFRRIIHLKKRFSHWLKEAKFNGFSAKCRHLTQKVNHNSFCFTCFLCYRKCSPNEVLLIFFGSRESGNFFLNSSGKLSKNEMSGSVRQRTLIALVEKSILSLRILKDNWRTVARRLQHGVTCVGCWIVTSIFSVH